VNSLQFRFPNADRELILKKYIPYTELLKKKYETRFKFVNFRRLTGHNKESPKNNFLILIKFDLK